MVLIHGSNIFVDDFKFTRSLRHRYIYFLTHFHADHYEGLTSSWKNEKIYCSPITKRLLQHKFPNLTNVEGLELNTPHVIYLNKEKSLFVHVTLLDANHCIGSTMLLFEGYMGTILHTGDFRFTNRMLKETNILYPAHKMKNDNEECSIHIDELILDDTYCDPIFKFPPRNEAYKAVIQIIEKAEGRRVCIALDTFGKEELLVHLAYYYNTKIVVSQRRYDNLRLAEYYLDLFTLNSQEGFIEAILKSEARKRLNAGSIVILPTGWCNDRWIETEPFHFMVGYSLHSNFEEIHAFVKSIKPGKLSTQWKTQANKLPIEKINKKQLNGFEFLKNFQQTGIKFLNENYVDSSKLSDEYIFFQNLENLIEVKIKLGLGVVEEKRTLLALKKAAEEKHPHIYGNKDKVRTGARVYAPENNPFLKNKEKTWINNIASKIKIERHFEEEKAGVIDVTENNIFEEAIEIENEIILLSKNPNFQQNFQEVESGCEWANFENIQFDDRGKEATKLVEYKGNQNLLYTFLNKCNDEDYLPFSEGSDDDKSESIIFEDSYSHNQMEVEKTIEGIQDQEQNEIFNKIFSQKNIMKEIYTGVMRLDIEYKGQIGTIQEAFSLCVNDPKVKEKWDLPEDLEISESIDYSLIKALLHKFLAKPLTEIDNEAVLGWVKSKANPNDSMLETLANHMKKNNIVRICRVNPDCHIYFLDASKTEFVLNEDARMIFLILS